MKKKLILLSLLVALSACADENTENALLKQRVNMLTLQNAQQQDRIKTLEMMLAQGAPVATQAAAPVVVQDHAAATAAAAAVQGAAVVAAQQAATQMEVAQMRDELAQAQIQAAQAQAAANQAAAQAQAAGGSGLGTLAMGAAAGVAGKYVYDKHKANQSAAPTTTAATSTTTPKTGSVIAPSAAKPAAAATPNYRPTTQGYAMTKQPSTVSAAAATAPTKSFGNLNAQGVKPSSVTLNKPTTTPSYRPTTSGYSNISKPSVSRPVARGR